MKPTRVESFLNVLEQREPDYWQWESEGDYWRVHYGGCRPPCDFHIEIGPTMLHLHAALKVKIRTHPELICHLAIYRYALRLNEELVGAKLGMSHNGKLSLMVDWPHASIDFSGFETAVQFLVHSFKYYYHDIQLVAQDFDLAAHIVGRELEERNQHRDSDIEFLELERNK